MGRDQDFFLLGNLLTGERAEDAAMPCVRGLASKIGLSGKREQQSSGTPSFFATKPQVHICQMVTIAKSYFGTDSFQRHPGPSQCSVFWAVCVPPLQDGKLWTGVERMHRRCFLIFHDPWIPRDETHTRES
jgi:hypothetical protein|mmetsp:Transcript_82655/g.138192  ORF Transcript_82655/g.138192 Transcript_82655/m.138192 type:complete len:131 (+) Transcript_82655:223-615(+)